MGRAYPLYSSLVSVTGCLTCFASSWHLSALQCRRQASGTLSPVPELHGDALAGAISVRRDWEGCFAEGGSTWWGRGCYRIEQPGSWQAEGVLLFLLAVRKRTALGDVDPLQTQARGGLAEHLHGSHCHEEELWDDKLNSIRSAVVSLSLRKPNSSPFPIARRDCAISPWADLVTVDHCGPQHRPPPDNRGPASQSDRVSRKQGSAVFSFR